MSRRDPERIIAELQDDNASLRRELEKFSDDSRNASLARIADALEKIAVSGDNITALLMQMRDR